MIEKFVSPGDKLELKSTVSVVLPDAMICEYSLENRGWRFNAFRSE